MAVRSPALVLLAACSFENTAPLGTSDANVVADAASDSSQVCTPGFLDLCSQPMPSGPLDIAGSDTINTDTDPRCTTYVQPSGRDVCLVYATTVSIDPGGTLTATGSRPLAIAATSTLIVAGTIDVSSQRGANRGPASSDETCAVMAAAEPDAGGAGGGAGASFGRPGGNGGNGDTDLDTTTDGVGTGGRSGAAATITVLRGGCRGEAGAAGSGTAPGGVGGHSGGALYLYAPDRIEISGIVRATGAGGSGGTISGASSGGGGGGGSGGLVIVESALVTISGQISANGGGGGEGSYVFNGTPRNGLPGDDGTVGVTPASGGLFVSGAPGGGDGGAGTTNATNGGSTVAGGGGGGGGVGIVRIIGAPTISGTVSPPSS